MASSSVVWSTFRAAAGTSFPSCTRNRRPRSALITSITEIEDALEEVVLLQVQADQLADLVEDLQVLVPPACLEPHGRRHVGHRLHQLVGPLGVGPGAERPENRLGLAEVGQGLVHVLLRDRPERERYLQVDRQLVPAVLGQCLGRSHQRQREFVLRADVPQQLDTPADLLGPAVGPVEHALGEPGEPQGDRVLLGRRPVLEADQRPARVLGGPREVPGRQPQFAGQRVQAGELPPVALAPDQPERRAGRRAGLRRAPCGNHRLRVCRCTV